MEKVKILPSIPPNAVPPNCILRIEEVGIEELRKISDAIVYIRHPPTIQVIQKLISRIAIDTGNASIQYGETFFVVSLPMRQPVPGIDVEVREDELLIRRITVLPP